MQTTTIEPVKELTSLKGQVSKLENAASSLTIASQDDYAAATDLVAQLKDRGSKIKILKESITKPANEILRNTRAMFAPVGSTTRQRRGNHQNQAPRLQAAGRRRRPGSRSQDCRKGRGGPYATRYGRKEARHYRASRRTQPEEKSGKFKYAQSKKSALSMRLFCHANISSRTK